MVNIPTQGIQKFSQAQKGSNMIGTAISSALSVGSNLVNMINQNKQNQRNLDAQREENQKARDYNTMMWEKNNAYNDPSAQMERLKNAGINPHLAYSNGQLMNTSNAPASSSASSLPAGIAPQMDVNGLMMAMRQSAEIGLIKAQTKKTESEAQSQTNLNETFWQSYDMDYAIKGAQKNLIGSNIQVNESQVKKNAVEISKIAEETENIKALTKLNQQQKLNLIAQTSVYKAQVEQLLSSAQYNRELSDNQKYVRNQIQADTVLKTMQANGISLDNEFKGRTMEERIKQLTDQGKRLFYQLEQDYRNTVIKEYDMNNAEVDNWVKRNFGAIGGAIKSLSPLVK